MIAEVIVNSRASELNRTFDYLVPEGVLVTLGMRVLVPFANRKIFEVGYVVGLKDVSSYKCKEIAKVIDKVFDEEKLELAKWISKRYDCNLSDSIRLLVPPGTGTSVDKVKTKLEKRLSVNSKVDKSLLKSDKQKRIISFLEDNPNSPKNIVKDFLGVSDAVINTLIKHGYINLREELVSRSQIDNKIISKTEALCLTNEQSKALSSISIDSYGKYLIHGVTGSGKTEIYLQLIEKVLKNGKNAIVLVPEISLTPQMTDRFLSRFGGVVAILHSGLSLRRKI